MKIAIISDIHEDVVNLKSALKQIEKEKCDEIVCLGDIVGFSEKYYTHLNTRNASECVSLLKQNCKIVIPGNHDFHAIKKTPQLSNGFKYPSNWYSLDIEKQKELAKGKLWLYEDGELETNLTDEDKDWLSNLPEIEILDNMLFCHSIFPNINGCYKKHVANNKDFSEHKKLMKQKNCKLSFSGHMHSSGIIISSWRLRQIEFEKVTKIKSGNCVIVPPIVNNKNGGAFSIFDTESMIIESFLI